MRAAATILALCVAMVSRAQQPFDLDSSYRTSISERYVNSLVALPDGKLVISGLMTFPEFPWSQIRLARLTPDGALDQSFEATGIGGGKITAWNDKYYVRGGQTVRRVELDGTNDLSFGISAGTVPYFFPGQGGDYHVYPDGRVLMTGLHVLSDSIRGFEGFYNLVWFTNSGYLDTTATHRQCDGSIDFIHALPDGKFLLSGVFTSYEGQPAGRIIRVHPDGALDTSFNTSIHWGQAYGCHVQSDGKILAAGRFQVTGDTDTLHLIRLMPDGTLDPTFNNHLSFQIDVLSGVTAVVTALRPLSNGRLAVLGGFDRVDGVERRGFVLIDTAGQLLSTDLAGAGCGTYTYMNFTYGSVRDLVPAPDGNYFIHGSFVGYDDGTVNDSTQRFVSRLYGLDVGSSELRPSPQGTLKVVPNPASTHTTFHYTLPAVIGSAHIVVMDAHGKRLDRLRATPPVGQLIWDTRKMPPGVYIVDLLGSSGSLVRERFVVQP